MSRRRGRFVDLEAVAPTAGGLEAERLKVVVLHRALGIDDRLLVAPRLPELLGA